MSPRGWVGRAGPVLVPQWQGEYVTMMGAGVRGEARHVGPSVTVFRGGVVRRHLVVLVYVMLQVTVCVSADPLGWDGAECPSVSGGWGGAPLCLASGWFPARPLWSGKLELDPFPSHLLTGDILPS